MTGNPAYLTGLDRNQANYAPLTPLTFLERAAYVFPTRLAVVHGAQRFTWAAYSGVKGSPSNPSSACCAHAAVLSSISGAALDVSALHLSTWRHRLPSPMARR